MQVQPAYYIHRSEVPPHYTGTIQYRDPTGCDQRIDAVKFFHLTGAKYSTTSFPTYRFIASLGDVEVDDVMYSHRFPEASDENLRLVHLQGENAFVGMGVVAARVIKCGQAICHYTGQYVADTQRGAEYQLGFVNAAHFRGLGAMVNHSFPNAKFGCWDHAGFKEWVVVAIDDIKEGEVVSADYGSSYQSVSLGMHAELRYDAAKAFINSANIEQEGLTELKNPEKWHYLACNPALLLELYFNGDWKLEEMKKFLSAVAVCVQLPKAFDAMRQWLLLSFEHLDEPLQALHELKPDLYKEIADYFKQACRSKSSIGAVYALRMLAGYLPDMRFTAESWSEACAKITPYVDAWELIVYKRITDDQSFTDKTPLHRAIRVLRQDPFLKGKSLI